jgi:hypothetical protein
MAGEKEKSWIVTQAPVQRGDVVLLLQPNRTTKPAHMLTTVARQSANVGIRMGLTSATVSKRDCCVFL